MTDFFDGQTEAVGSPESEQSGTEGKTGYSVGEAEAEQTAAEASAEKEKLTARRVFRKIFDKYIITAFSGMALGLFCTLIAGTIIGQIGSLIGHNKAGYIISYIGTAAKVIMGAGVGVGIAHSFKANKLTMFSAAAAGMIGANITNIFVASGVHVWGASGTQGVFAVAIGDPVASYAASVAAVEIGKLIEGRTPVDILLVPLGSVVAGTFAGIVLGIPFGMLFALLGKGISRAIEWEPISFGIIIAVVMGLLLTLPTSSAAFGVMLFGNVSALEASGLLGASRLAAAAACAGCCAHMVGFAVASFRENKWGGLISQGIGTSMLQIPNLAKNARILIPAVIASAVAGPLTSAAFKLVCDASGSGMGTAGLVGVIQTIIVSHDAGLGAVRIIFGVAVCYFIVPAVVALVTSEIMRKFKFIKYGDMRLIK